MATISKSQIISYIKSKINSDDFPLSYIINNLSSGIITENELTSECNLNENQIGQVLKGMFMHKLENNAFTSDNDFQNGITRLLNENVCTEDELKKLLWNNIITNKAYPEPRLFFLVRNKILSDADIREIFKTRVKNRMYIEDEISFLQKTKKIFKAEDLKGLISDKLYFDLFPIGQSQWSLETIDIGDLPDLEPNRVDVFTLGAAGSGKSCFLGGIMACANKLGRCDINIENLSGFKYGDELITYLNRGILPPATPVGLLQHIGVDFTDENNGIHPVSFIEMAGENFEKCFAQKVEKINPKLRQYLFGSENKKVFILCLDYKRDVEKQFIEGPTQQSLFEFMLKFLKQQGTLNTTKAVAIVITKWDLSEDNSIEAASDFLNSEFMNLVNLCKKYAEEYKFEFEVFPFSLGYPENNGTWKYIMDNSHEIFNWLMYFLPVKKTIKKRWFFNLFK